MAGKRNKIGEVPTSSLSRAVAALVAELAEEKVPRGWVPFQDLVIQTKCPAETLKRILKGKNTPKQHFRIRYNNMLRKIVHYYIGK